MTNKVILGVVVLALVALVAVFWKPWAPTVKVAVPDFCGWSTGGDCNHDVDCVPAGCSGQVCRGQHEENIVTTCEYKECYNAESYGMACSCVNGKCRWALSEGEEEYCGEMSWSVAREIAINSECLSEEPGTEISTNQYCNENTGTWWVDLILEREGCSPACVVNVNTGDAEINWRCTGLAQ
ncbi:MAG TPA: eight-cysteine-cluster domain-containing protein [archaeon]|nr:eight-cysteine-cluster domain-containing protein [archaeon]